uniref:Uncharacterized protein n=1 Tax=Cacopsylla melanoneura TaxID=428564 RepID=A0A8D9E735_9HEMI
MSLPRSILCSAVFVWILFVQFTPITGTYMTIQTGNGTPYRKFGCDFENDKYALHTESVTDVRYGGDIIPMDISQNQFDDMVKKIESVITKLLNELTYNNAGYLLDFYNAFKESKTPYEEFRNFYMKYNPPFRPNEVCSSMAVELLDRIAADIPAIPIANHSYLSTCAVNVDNSFLESLGITEFEYNEGCQSESINLLEHLATTIQQTFNKSDLNTCAVNVQASSLLENLGMDVKDFENDPKEPAKKKLKTKDTRSTNKEPPRTFTHGHVAAFIRIRLEGTRLGYILLDPGFGIQRPVIIMEDGKPPHMVDVMGTSRASQGEKFEFSLPSPNLPYILARTSRDDDPSGENHLFYVGRPFCSFLQSVTKPTLLTPFKNMARRKESGFPRAAVYFDISKSSPKFTFALYNDFEDPQKRTVDFGGRGNLTKEIKDHYIKVLGYLDTPKQNITTKILETMEEIARDEDFLKHMEITRKMVTAMRRGIRVVNFNTNKNVSQNESQ